MRDRTLNDFIGHWQIDRQITHADGTSGQFCGTAQWSPDGDGAQYVEIGTLTVAGQGQFNAERRYLWGNDLAVRFDDGRFFHSVPPQGGATGHWCDPDQYDVTYDFSDWPNWQCTWIVNGPRKNYRMTTFYTPSKAQ